MTLQIETFSRRTFDVEGVQVTDDNINEVAEWCGGSVRTSAKVETDEAGHETGKTERPFIKVDVHRALNDRQTKAFVGDWVLKSSSGFKVYTGKAFDISFVRKDVDKPVILNTDEDAVQKAAQGQDVDAMLRKIAEAP